MELKAKFLIVASALVTANFLFRSFTDQDWAKGLEISYYQIAALFIAWTVFRKDCEQDD